MSREKSRSTVATTDPSELRQSLEPFPFSGQQEGVERGTLQLPLLRMHSTGAKNSTSSPFNNIIVLL
jgi:hypothetical protein